MFPRVLKYFNVRAISKYAFKFSVHFISMYMNKQKFYVLVSMLILFDYDNALLLYSTHIL